MSSAIDSTPFIAKRLETRLARLIPDGAALPKATAEIAEIRQVLEELRATPQRLRSEQVDFYGTHAWCERFQFLGQIEQVPGLRPKGAELRLQLWKLLEHSRFRSVGEAVAHLDHRVIPGFTVAKGGVINFAFGRRDLNRGSLLALVVDPDLVSNELLQSTGICDFAAMQGDPIGRWRAKWSLRNVTLLKGVLEASQPLATGRGERVARIGTLSMSSLRRYGPFADELNDILREREGRIIVTQQTYRHTGTLEVPYRILTYFPGIFPALRRPKHVQAGHDGEMEKLARIAADVQSIIPSISAWGKLSGTEREDVRGLARQIGEECATALKSVKHPLKRSIRRLVVLAQGITDSGGRTNPSTALNELHRGLLSLGRRQAEVSTIQGFVSTDDRALANDASRSHVALRLYLDRLVSAGLRLEEEFRGVQPQDAGRAAGKFLRSNRLDVETLTLSNLEPYRAVRSAIQAGVHRVNIALYDLNIPNATQALKGLIALTIADGVQAAVEEVRTHLIKPKSTPHDYWRGAVRLTDTAAVARGRIENGIQVVPMLESLDALTAASAEFRGWMSAASHAERTTWKDPREARTTERKFKAACDAFDLEAVALRVRSWLEQPTVPR